MYQEIFESLGLSPNEARIYETLLERGESSVSDIATAAKVHRRNAYDAVRRLIEKGLCFQVFSAGETHYNAVDPGKLSELINDKQEQLASVLPDLKKKFFERYAPEEVYIYRGYEGQKNIWRDILRVGKDVLNLGAKGQWFDPKLDVGRTAFFKEANRRKIVFYNLFDYEIKTQKPDFPKDFLGNLKYRYLPKEYSTNSVVNTFGDYVVTYTGITPFKMSEDTVFFILHSKDLAQSYEKWFWYMWEQSAEGKVGKPNK